MYCSLNFPSLLYSFAECEVLEAAATLLETSMLGRIVVWRAFHIRFSYATSTSQYLLLFYRIGSVFEAQCLIKFSQNASTERLLFSLQSSFYRKQNFISNINIDVNAYV